MLQLIHMSRQRILNGLLVRLMSKKADPPRSEMLDGRHYPDKKELEYCKHLRATEERHLAQAIRSGRKVKPKCGKYPPCLQKEVTCKGASQLKPPPRAKGNVCCGEEMCPSRLEGACELLDPESPDPPTGQAAQPRYRIR